MLKSSKAIRWSIFSIIINSNISLAEPIYTNSEVLPINLCTKPKVAGIPKESAFGWDANSVDCLKGDYSLFSKNGLYGAVDYKGKVVIKPSYLAAAPLGNGVFIFTNKSKKLGVLNSKKEVLLPFFYDSIIPNKSGYAIVGKDNKYGQIDQFGKWIIPLEYDGLVYNSDPFLLSYKNNKVGMLAIEDGKILAENIYDSIITNFTLEGYHRTSINGTKGYIDDRGNSVYVPLEKQNPIYKDLN